MSVVRILTLFDDEPIDPDTLNTGKRKKHVQSKASATPKEQKILEEQKETSIVDQVVAKPTKKNKVSESKQMPEFAIESLEKQYYTIGETAKMFKVNTSHIRFWTQQFALKMRTNRKGDRLYTPENIKELYQIHHLVKQEGFTIAGAKTKLKELKKNSEPNIVFDSATINVAAGTSKGLNLTYIKHQLLQLKELLFKLKYQL